MNKVKRTIILSIFIFIAMLSFNTVKASSASISSNKTSMTVGQTATITVTIKAASWNLAVSGDATDTIVGYSDDGENTTKKETINFTPTKKGTYTIKLTGDVTDGTTIETTTVSDSVKITVTEASSSSSNSSSSSSSSSSSGSSSSSSKSTVSSTATLSNLGITPEEYDFSTFKSNTTSYSVTVPYEVETIKIYATATSSKATITGTGSKTLSVGKNTFNVKVTAQDGTTTKTYTLIITREEDDGTDASLSSLGITPDEYDFSNFKSDTTSYDVTVPYDLEEIEIYAKTKSSKAAVSGTGVKTIEVGKNTFEVVVTGGDGETTKTYTLNIYREDEDGYIPIGLINLEVTGYSISPEFYGNIYEYTVDITELISTIDIVTEVSSDTYEVEIEGNENLQEGENTINVLIYNSEDETTETYILTVNMSELDLTELNNVIEEAQLKLKLQRWIVIATIIIIVILIIIFLIERYRIGQEIEEKKNETSEEENITDENNEERLKNESEEITNNEVYDFDLSLDKEEKTKRKRSSKKGKRFK